MPIHTEKRRRSLWDTLLLVVAGLMIVQGFVAGDPMPVLFGGGVGAFLALTKHTRYGLYQDVVVIRFMAPRRIVIPLSELQDVRMVKMPLGGAALLVQRSTGGTLAIMPVDPEGFLARLKARPGADPQSKPEDGDAERPAPRRRRRP